MNLSRFIPTLALLTLACPGFAAATGQPPPPQPTDGPPPPPARTESLPAQDAAAFVRDFSQARQTYLNTRRELEQASRKASGPQRQALREQLKAQRDAQARWRDELRQQLRELRDQLPSHGDLIDEARERPGSRPRRGD
ncbi:MAG: hypothetical protein JXQ71_05920 [Verrucomicrobia bacterium]|nr:hypothetical protein [Verrucomicrobiota bacterium]